MTNVFSKIIAKELPADIVYETDKVIAFKDINPAAPVHILILPKKEIKDLQSLQPEDYPLLGEIVAAAQQLAKEFKLFDGYRFLANNGPFAGQEVPHLHFHLIGGHKLGRLG